MKYDIQYDLDVYSYSDFIGGTVENKCLVMKVEGFLVRGEEPEGGNQGVERDIVKYYTMRIEFIVCIIYLCLSIIKSIKI